MARDAVTNGVAKRQRLAQRRKALGLTQEALAELLDVAWFDAEQQVLLGVLSFAAGDLAVSRIHG